MNVASPVEFTDEELLRLAATGPGFGDARLPQRFWEKVEVSAQTGCWIWTACRHPNGYAKFRYHGATQSAHRVAYEELAAPLPKFVPGGPQLDHLCRRRDCVLPSHLELVSARINIARAAGASAASVRSRAVSGKCLRGHVDWVPNHSTAGMKCQTCEKDRKRERNARYGSDIMAAARLLGMTWREYTALHGQSAARARDILSGAA